MFEIGQKVTTGDGEGKIKIVGADKDGGAFLVEFETGLGPETRWFRENEIHEIKGEVYLVEG